MPTPIKGRHLGGSAAHQRLMLSNLATALFDHGSITTTEARARQLQPLAEKLISKARRGDLHARRLVMRTIRDKGVVARLFEEIAPSFDKNREGGCTRIIKTAPRKGDNAPMAVIELVTEPVAKKKKAARPAAKQAAPAKAAEKPAEEAEEKVEAPAEETPAEETTEAPAAEEAAAEEAPAEEAKEEAKEEEK